MELANYKVYQLISFFVLKFSYTTIMLKDPINTDSSNNEVFLINKENPINIIRISTNSIFGLSSDEERINKVVNALSRRFDLDNTKLLNIYICNQDYNPNSSLNNICIDSLFYSGKDYSDNFPGIKNVIHEVNDEKEEITRIISDLNTNATISRKRKLARFKIKNYVTFIVGLLCILNYIVTLFLNRTYSSSASLIIMGADYRMFTYGLGQYWRLITYAFTHGSLTHIVCNLYSLFILGRYMESEYGHLKYALVLFLSVLAGSLTFGIFNSNSLVCGLSGGIYGLWGLYLIKTILNKRVVSRGFYYTLFLNILLNFISGVAWQAHFGGLVCGILMYFIFERKEQFISMVVCLALMFGGLGYKYFSSDKISPFYRGTDYEVVNFYNKIGLSDYANNMMVKLLNIYENNRGE